MSSILFQYLSQLLYSKSFTEYAWEFRTIEHLDPDIKELYETQKNRVPGGGVLKETDQEYYMIISAGKHPSPEGFKIESLRMARDQTGKDHSLYVRLSPSMDASTEDYPGEANITSLISIPKSGLPDGAAINGVTMIGAD